jgi:acyl dehydratase
MADEFWFPLDATAIMLFASALGDANPIYFDEVAARGSALGGVIAPPTFGVASAHWNPRHVFRGVRQIPPRASAASGESAAGAAQPERAGGGSLARVLHGEQRFEYHEPLRPGMRLRVETRPGRSWEKEGRRGGTLRFSESVSEYRDESGRLVLTATSVGIVTGRAVEG